MVHTALCNGASLGRLLMLRLSAMRSSGQNRRQNGEIISSLGLLSRPEASLGRRGGR